MWLCGCLYFFAVSVRLSKLWAAPVVLHTYISYLGPARVAILQPRSIVASSIFDSHEGCPLDEGREGGPIDKVMKLKAMKATKSMKAAQSMKGMKATNAMKAIKAKSPMKSVEDPCYLDWVELRGYNDGFGVQAPTLKEPRGMFRGNFVAPNLALFQFVFTHALTW